MRKYMCAVLAALLMTGCAAETVTPEVTEEPEEVLEMHEAEANPDLTEPIRPLTIEYTKTVSVNKDEPESMTVIFSRLPENAQEIFSVDRSDEEGKYLTLAFLISAFRTWTPEDQDTCAEMMKVLMNSPTAGDVYSDQTKMFVKDRMLQNDKWQYIADSYLGGAAPENGYTAVEPYTVTASESPEEPQRSTIYGTELEVTKCDIKSAGAEAKRSVSLYQDPVDGNWYIWSDNWSGLLADIRALH